MSETQTPPASVEVPDYLQRLLKKIAAREGFSDYSIVSQRASSVGDGFQGLMLSVAIRGNRILKDDDKLVLICKIPPLSEFRRQIALDSFKQEVYAYDYILPEIVKFQREKGVADDEGFFTFPKCYGTYSNEETLEFAIVLEDLRETGYRMWNKYQPIDFNHVRLAITQLRKFHAISYALREQKPKLFAKFHNLHSNVAKGFDENLFQAEEFFKNSFQTAIDTLSEDDIEERRKMEYLQNNLATTIQRVTNGKLAEPFTVLSHGYFWNNNIMYQYESEDSLIPQRVSVIDWQMGQYTSPVNDLFYFIYSSTEQPLRSEHFDDILQTYHRNLAKLLKRLGGDPNRQLSSDDLQNQARQFGVFALFMAPMLVQIVTIKPEDLPDLDAMTPYDDFVLMTKNADGYDVRMSDVIRDFVGRGYFGDEHMSATIE